MPAEDAAGDPGHGVSASIVRSARHRVVTRARLAAMWPRRRRYLRHLVASTPASAQPARAQRILVVAHVYYPELWPELADAVARVPGDADLTVTLVEARADGLQGEILARFPRATVRVVENRGRDMWPFIQVLDQLTDHDLVLKLHTKRSPHMRKGDAWRRELVEGICGSPDQVAAILELFRSDPRIGIVSPPPRNVLGREFLGANTTSVRELSDRAGLPFEPGRLWFPAGSMFWARADVVRPLGSLGLVAEDFGPETGAIDGTLAHALERVLGVSAAAQGLAVVDSAEAARLLDPRG